MMVAPEPYLSAVIKLMGHVILEVRAGHWGNVLTHEQTADYMDAIHNLPGLILNWETCDVKMIRDHLSYFDEKWSKSKRPYLVAIYDKLLAGQSPYTAWYPEEQSTTGNAAPSS